jgi:arginase family enzyme
MSPGSIAVPRVDLAALPLRRTLPFLRVPGPQERTASRVGIVGIPFDCGAHPLRVGARLGPAAIREQSQLLRPYNPPDFDFVVHARRIPHSDRLRVEAPGRGRKSRQDPGRVNLNGNPHDR